jgi:putative transposase
MSRFRKLSHVLWHCQYHIVWVPKYRYRVLKDRVGFEIAKTIRIFTERLGCEVVELNVQPDHVLCGAPHNTCNVKFRIM